jgi:hypothetical protein
MPIINIEPSALTLLKAMASDKDFVVSHIGRTQLDGSIDVVISIPTYKKIVASRLVGESYTTVILRLTGSHK